MPSRCPLWSTAVEAKSSGCQLFGDRVQASERAAANTHPVPGNDTEKADSRCPRSARNPSAGLGRGTVLEGMIPGSLLLPTEENTPGGGRSQYAARDPASRIARHRGDGSSATLPSPARG